MHSTKCGIGLPGIVIIVVVTVVVIVIVIIVVVVIIIIVVIAIFTSVTLVSLMDALSDVDSGIPSPSDAAAPAVDVPVPDLGGLSDAASSGDLLAGLSDAVTEGDGDGPGDDKVEASVDASLCHTRRNGGGANAIPLSDWMVDVTRPSNKKRMKHFRQKLRREEKRHSRVLHKQNAKMRATQHIWNRTQLRRGERLDMDVDKINKQQKRWIHPSAWTARGCLVLAFRSLGTLTPDAKSLRKTRREIDAISSTCLAACAHQSDAGKGFADVATNSSNPPQWLVIERAHDCSPMKVSFGNLRSVLAPEARYWTRDRSQPPGKQWKMMDAEVLALGGYALPKQGIIEMMAQDGRISWPETIQDRGEDLSSQ